MFNKLLSHGCVLRWLFLYEKLVLNRQEQVIFLLQIFNPKAGMVIHTDEPSHMLFFLEPKSVVH